MGEVTISGKFSTKLVNKNTIKPQNRASPLRNYSHHGPPINNLEEKTLRASSPIF